MRSKTTKSDVAAMSATLLRLEAQFGELDAELDQLRSIIASTASSLSTSFAELAPLTDDAGSLSQQLRDHVSSGIISLQFEDIASQLIEHVRRRKAVVHELVSRLATVVSEARDAKALKAQLSIIDSDAEAMVKSLAHRPVQQTSMATGEIDLF